MADRFGVERSEAEQQPAGVRTVEGEALQGPRFDAMLQDFLVEDRLISAVGDHPTGVTGGAEGEDSYASFFLLASLRALTPR